MTPRYHIPRDLKTAGEIEFALAFVTKQAEVDSLAKAIAKKAKGDAVVWLAVRFRRAEFGKSRA